MPEQEHEVVLYTRAGCCLCESAKEAIAQARRTVSFAYREVDIDGDPRLFAAHRYDIPVIEVDGNRAFKHRVAAAALVERLRR
ncbi:MAG TPA: glutaredoxin family protein [Myxococcales bacterium]|nr:glutaredoxin family protein [Myxococcales bacterium]